MSMFECFSGKSLCIVLVVVVVVAVSISKFCILCFFFLFLNSLYTWIYGHFWAILKQSSDFVLSKMRRTETCMTMRIFCRVLSVDIHFKGPMIGLERCVPDFFLPNQNLLWWKILSYSHSLRTIVVVFVEKILWRYDLVTLQCIWSSHPLYSPRFSNWMDLSDWPCSPLQDEPSLLAHALTKSSDRRKVSQMWIK